jgi:hypothetical protein
MPMFDGEVAKSLAGVSYPEALKAPPVQVAGDDDRSTAGHVLASWLASQADDSPIGERIRAALQAGTVTCVADGVGGLVMVVPEVGNFRVSLSLLSGRLPIEQLVMLGVQPEARRSILQRLGIGR